MKKIKKKILKFLQSAIIQQFVVGCLLLVFLVQSISVLAQNTNQNIKVTGVITDDLSKEPLIGVNVIITGKSKGTITDVNGKYSIEANYNDVLKFSYIGYQDKKLKVTGGILNVILDESALKLGEVVVQAGYGGVRKKDITGAVVSVSGKDLEKKMSGNVMDALQGASSGVQVLGSSGDPNADESIRIRGISTLTDGGVNPLYIVDGMVVDRIDNINPSDIKSIDIMKDASSAAIYGSRSANGVILITTKQGEVGKPKYNVKYLRSYSNLSHKILQSNAAERIIYQNRNFTLPGVFRGNNDSTSLFSNNDNDYQTILAKTGIRDQVDVGLSGGNKELKYFNSIQYLSQKGIVGNSYSNRLTGRINVDYTPNKTINTSTRVSYSYDKGNSVDEGGVFGSAVIRNPSFLLTFSDGTPAYNIAGQNNPLANEILRKNETARYNVTMMQALNINFNNNLSFHSDITGKFDLKRNETFQSKLLSTANPQVNSGDESFSWDTYLSNSNYFSYKYTIKSNSKIEATVGSSSEIWKNIYERVGGNNYITETVTTANSISTLLPQYTYSSKSNHSLLGLFARARYDYKGKYLLNATIRRDGSSRFGVDNRWGWFPSASAAWRFSDESFMSWAKPILSDAKFRAGWGTTGNERIGDYVSQMQYTFGTNYYNGVSGVIASNSLGNKDLKWEETKQTNIGADFTLFNGALVLSTDYYKKDTKDLLYTTPLPQEVGASSAWTNFGSIENKGLEITLTATPVQTANFKWETSLNYSRNHNTITNLSGVSRADGNWWIGEGVAAGSFYGYKQLGIYKYNESNAWTDDFKTNLVPIFQKDELGNVIIGKDRSPVLQGYTLPDGKAYAGTIKQKKANGVISKGGDVIWAEVPDANGNVDGVIQSNDRQVLGSGQPKWYGAWSNTFTYKGFTLSVSAYGSFGNLIFNQLFNTTSNLATSGNTPPPYILYNLWKYPGQVTHLYNANDVTAANSRSDGSYFLEDGSFIRLQSVRLGYTLDKKLLKKTPFDDVTISIYGNNIATWTNYTGYDPEVGQNSVLKPGNDTGRYPRKSEYGFSVNLSL